MEAAVEQQRQEAKEKATLLKAAQTVLKNEAKARGEEYHMHADRKPPLKGNLINAMKTFEIKSDDKMKASWDQNVRQAWLSAVVDNISARFADDPITAALDSLFNPLHFPEGALPDNHAQGSLEVLLSHYGVARAGNDPVIDAVKARTDWGHFVYKMQEIRASWKAERTMTMADLLHPILVSTWSKICPGITLLAQSALVFPPHTVANETGFSKLKLLKTDLRNLLLEENTNNLLMILVEGPDPANFCSDDCVRSWYPLRKRRLEIFNMSACKSLKELKAAKGKAKPAPHTTKKPSKKAVKMQ